MQRVNELFGKDVINQNSGEKQGTVQEVVFDEEARNIVALLVGGLVGRDRAVRWTSVASVGEVVVIEGEGSLAKLGDDPEVAELREASHKITGTDILTEGGEKVGRVHDLFVDERGRLVGYEVSRGTVSDLRGRKFLPMQNVRAAGKDAVVVSSPDLVPIEEADEEAEKDKG